jgi:hypothetical protein
VAGADFALTIAIMADELFLSLWYADLRLETLPAAVVAVLRQFPFSPTRLGVRAAAVYPLDWSESPIYQRIYEDSEIPNDPEGVLLQCETAVGEALESVHDDYAYEFEIYWDLWAPTPEDAATEGITPGKFWREQPSLVRLAAFGPQFEDGYYEQNGHLRLDLGLDAPFLHEELQLDAEGLVQVEKNVARLLTFATALERHAGIASRLLWSESENNLAQKLIERLQKLN